MSEDRASYGIEQGNTITIVPHLNKNYKTIDLRPLYDDRLSWQAKGLHTYLISRPKNWKTNKQDLINRSKNGRDAVTAMIKELKECGYLFIIQIPGNNKGLIETIWITLSEPVTSNLEEYENNLKTSILETRTPVFQSSGKSATNNKDLYNISMLNKESTQTEQTLDEISSDERSSNETINRMALSCEDTLGKTVASVEFSMFGIARKVLTEWFSNGADKDEVLSNYVHFLKLKDSWVVGRRFSLFQKHYSDINQARLENRFTLRVEFEDNKQVERPRTLNYSIA